MIPPSIPLFNPWYFALIDDSGSQLWSKFSGFKDAIRDLVTDSDQLDSKPACTFIKNVFLEIGKMSDLPSLQSTTVRECSLPNVLKRDPSSVAMPSGKGRELLDVTYTPLVVTDASHRAVSAMRHYEDKDGLEDHPSLDFEEYVLSAEPNRLFLYSCHIQWPTFRFTYVDREVSYISLPFDVRHDPLFIAFNLALISTPTLIKLYDTSSPSLTCPLTSLSLEPVQKRPRHDDHDDTFVAQPLNFADVYGQVWVPSRRFEMIAKDVRAETVWYEDGSEKLQYTWEHRWSECPRSSRVSADLLEVHKRLGIVGHHAGFDFVRTRQVQKQLWVPISDYALAGLTCGDALRILVGRIDATAYDNYPGESVNYTSPVRISVAPNTKEWYEESRNFQPETGIFLDILRFMPNSALASLPLDSGSNLGETLSWILLYLIFKVSPSGILASECAWFEMDTIPDILIARAHFKAAVGQLPCDPNWKNAIGSDRWTKFLRDLVNETDHQMTLDDYHLLFIEMLTKADGKNSYLPEGSQLVLPEADDISGGAGWIDKRWLPEIGDFFLKSYASRQVRQRMSHNGTSSPRTQDILLDNLSSNKFHKRLALVRLPKTPLPPDLSDMTPLSGDHAGGLPIAPPGPDAAPLRSGISPPLDVTNGSNLRSGSGSRGARISPSGSTATQPSLSAHHSSSYGHIPAHSATHSKVPNEAERLLISAEMRLPPPLIVPFPPIPLPQPQSYESFYQKIVEIPQRIESFMDLDRPHPQFTHEVYTAHMAELMTKVLEEASELLHEDNLNLIKFYSSKTHTPIKSVRSDGIHEGKRIPDVMSVLITDAGEKEDDDKSAGVRIANANSQEKKLLPIHYGQIISVAEMKPTNPPRLLKASQEQLFIYVRQIVIKNIGRQCDVGFTCCGRAFSFYYFDAEGWAQSETYDMSEACNVLLFINHVLILSGYYHHSTALDSTITLDSGMMTLAAGVQVKIDIEDPLFFGRGGIRGRRTSVYKVIPSPEKGARVVKDYWPTRTGNKVREIDIYERIAGVTCASLVKMIHSQVLSSTDKLRAVFGIFSPAPRIHVRLTLDRCGVNICNTLGSQKKYLEKEESERQRTIKSIITATREALKASQCLLERNIIHGDIAPGNIYIAEDGGQPFLSDFGLAYGGETSRRPPSGTMEFLSKRLTKAAKRNRFYDIRESDDAESFVWIIIWLAYHISNFHGFQTRTLNHRECFQPPGIVELTGPLKDAFAKQESFWRSMDKDELSFSSVSVFMGDVLTWIDRQAPRVFRNRKT